MMYDFIFSVGKKVLAGEAITRAEALNLAGLADDDIPLLLAVANKVRSQFTGNVVDTCEIINARSGGCSEDCKFCAQSAHHTAKISAYPLVSEDEIIAAAKQAETDGAQRFCIVTAGCGMANDPDFAKIIAAINRIGRETNLNRCCSLGILEEQHVAALKEAGITRCHHNLETGESFYPKICTTHNYQERVATIRRIKAAGLQVCSGGIIGMGETWEQRLELAFALRELDVDSVPINILNPVPGTALAGVPRLRPLEILQSFAIFRLILPAKILRYAGGCERNLGELLPLGYLSGLNGTLLGNYLTTPGRNAEADLATIKGLGLSPG